MMKHPHDVLCDALITTYTGDHYGIRLGANLADVTQWVPRMRPYRGYENGGNKDFITTVYAITHVIYTLNDYNAYRLRPDWLRAELSFCSPICSTSSASMIRKRWVNSLIR